MGRSLAQLESELRALAASLAEVQDRLAALEVRAGGGEARRPTPPPRISAPTEATREPRSESRATELLTLVGRTLLVLGGGYLLRAITENKTVPGIVGPLLGLVYAVAMVFYADRAARSGRRGSALAHGLASLLLGLPLVWESSVRFGLLMPWAAAGALLLVVAPVLSVAWRRGLEVLAWAASIGALVTCFATMAGTRSVAPFAALLLVLGVALIWDPWRRQWQVLEGLIALATDLAFLFLALTSMASRGGEGLLRAGVLLALPFLYVSSFGLLERLHRRALDTFAAWQTGVALLLGLGGALLVIWKRPPLPMALGAVLLALSALAYGLAFRVIERAHRPSFHYFAALGMILLLVSSALLLHRPGTVWAILAVVSAVLAARFRRRSLYLHAALSSTAALVASGLPILGFYAFVARASWPRYPLVEMSGWLAAVICLAMPRPERPRVDGPLVSAARLLLVLVATFGVGTTVLFLLRAVLPVLAKDAGLMAVARTSVLAAAALLLAAASSKARMRMGRWLVHPLLLLGGIKLVVEDLPQGRPSTLFLSFVIFGGALILAPRLLRIAARRRTGVALAEETLSPGPTAPTR